MLNHTPGISSWERARKQHSTTDRECSRPLLQVIPHRPSGRGPGGEEPLVCIYHCGGHKVGSGSPTPPSHSQCRAHGTHTRCAHSGVTSSSSWTRVQPRTGVATSEGSQLFPPPRRAQTTSPFPGNGLGCPAPNPVQGTLSIPAELEPSGSPWTLPQELTPAGGSAELRSMRARLLPPPG